MTKHLKVFDEWQLKAMEENRFKMFAEVIDNQDLQDYADFVKPIEGRPGYFVHGQEPDHKDIVEIVAPYAIGDRIVVQEEWVYNDPFPVYRREHTTCGKVEVDRERKEQGISYRADFGGIEDDIKWEPANTMPCEFARKVFKVTDATAKLAKDVTEEEIRFMGVIPNMVVSGACGQDGQWINVPDYHHPFIAKLKAKHGPDAWDKYIFLYTVKEVT